MPWEALMDNISFHKEIFLKTSELKKKISPILFTSRHKLFVNSCQNLSPFLIFVITLKYTSVLLKKKLILR